MLTEYAREVNPDIFIVAGGPQVYRKYFDKFDCVVVGEAETSLEHIVNNYPNVDHVIESERATDFTVSPYINQLPSVLDIKNDSNQPLGVIFETSRGCPYGCSYCDWGSLTLQKVQFFDLDKVRNELEVICRDIQPSYMFLADANFGIVERDIEIAKIIVEMKKKYGYPKSFYYSVSKNHPKRNIEIGKILFEGGVVDNYIVSVVHTNRDVLTINSRGNIGTKKFKELAQHCVEHRMPTQTQLIQGLPGDTVDSWYESFCETFEWGLHAESKPYWYNVLPNAPMNNQKFWDEWKIETQKIVFAQARLKGPDELIDKAAEVIVACKSFDREDWIKMNKDSRWLQALHNFALLRNVAKYYRFVKDVPYKTFYRFVIDFFALTELGRTFNDQYDFYLRQILNPARAGEHTPFVFNDEIRMIEPEDVLFVWLVNNKDEFYRLIEQQLEQSDIVKDVIEFNKNLIIDLEYNPIDGRTMHTKYDWLNWFESLESIACFDHILQGPTKIDHTFHTNQVDIVGSTEWTSSRILWHKTKNEKRKFQLYAKAILGQIDFRGERTQLKHWTSVS